MTCVDFVDAAKISFSDDDVLKMLFQRFAHLDSGLHV